MASEASAVDIQQKPTPDYLKTVLGHLQQQAEPQSFWEHAAASFIPFVGPIAHSLANDRRQARINQATMNTGLFDTLVQQGYLPDGPEATAIGQKLGMPDAVLRAGILESAKVRATPGYQGRQLFQEAMPSWTENQPFVTRSPNATGNAPYAAGYATPVQAQGFTDTLQKQNTDRHLAAFRTFAEQNPEVFGALGSPDTGRLAIEAGEYAKADALSQFLGLPTSTSGGTVSPSASQSPLTAPRSPLSVTPPSAPPVPQPGLPAGAGQPAQPEAQPGGQQSSQVPFVSPAVLQARKAYVQLAPEMRQRLEDAVQAAVVKYPNVSRGEALAITGIESQFNPQAQGPVTKEGWRALGLMQLSPGVIGKYNVTDPFNVAQNVNAGMAEFSRLKDLYKGNTQLALAAYNAGEGTVGQYGGIPPYPETRAYVQNVPQVQQWLENHPYAQSLAPNGQGSPMLVAGEGTAPGPQQTTGQAPAVAQIPLPAPGQTPQALPPGVDPLGQFDPKGRPIVIKQATVGVSGGKRSFNIVLQSPAERGVGYVAFWTDQDPNNYRVALRDVLGKSVSLDPTQMGMVEKMAVERSLVANYQAARADTRLTEAQARERAVQRTQQSTGVLPTEAQIASVINPVALSGETTGAQRAAETAEASTPEAVALRQQKPIDEAKGKEQGRLASRVTSEQQVNFLLPDGSSPKPSMTQAELESSGAREVGKQTIDHLDQLSLIQENLKAMQAYQDEYDRAVMADPSMRGVSLENLKARYEIQRRNTARLLDKIAAVGSERERLGGGGGIGIGPLRIGAFGTDMKQLLDALPEIASSTAGVALGEALSTVQAHRDVIWRRTFGTGAP